MRKDVLLPKPLQGLISKADNSLVRELEDEEHYCLVSPDPVKRPRLRLYSLDAAKLIGLSRKDLRSRAFVEIFVGNRSLGPIKSWATLYGRLRDGYWCGRQGDGRAVSICEVKHNDARLEIQLKGSGETPYACETSRVPGRVTLKRAMREFLASEAMYYLQVPTTRALSVIAFEKDRSWDNVCAVLTRIAPSFLRFGHLEVFWKEGEFQEMKKMLHHVLGREFPDLAHRYLNLGDHAAVVEMFEQITARQFSLVAHWFRVGFVHGNLASDNCALGGFTIDYDTFGFFEPSSYLAGNLLRQNSKVLENLEHLGRALFSLMVHLDPTGEASGCTAESLESKFNPTSSENCARAALVAIRREVGRKLGLRDGAAAWELFFDVVCLISDSGVDFTTFFRRLCMVDLSKVNSSDTSDNSAPTSVNDISCDAHVLQPLMKALTIPSQAIGLLMPWIHRYAAATLAEARDPEERQREMRLANPKYILRNWMLDWVVEEAIKGNDAPAIELFQVLKHPYDEQSEATEKRWYKVRRDCE